MSLFRPGAYIGKRVAGRYRVSSELRRGGMGAVYLATQEPLEREIALKIMLPGAAADQALRRRFIQEAQALSRVPHPNIVTIFDFGEVEDGSLFIAMELVHGRNLRELLDANGPVDWRDTLAMSIGATRALVAAHAGGITHRDLKPDNVMLVGDRWVSDDVRLLDFGLARALGVSEGVTQLNVVPGTPHYIAPERVASRTDDPRSDLYALGAIWFELLTGKLPFNGETVAAILLAHVQQEVPSLAGAAPGLKVPTEVEQIVARLLAKQPDARWPSAEELLGDLVAVEERLQDARAGRRPAGGALGPAKTPRPGANRWTSSAQNDAAEAKAKAGLPKEGLLRVERRPLSRPNAERPAPGTQAAEELKVGGEAVAVASELDAGRRRLVCAATLRGTELRRVEIEVPELSRDGLITWVAAARADFIAGLRLLVAKLPVPPAESAEARLFFVALDAYLGGDAAAALRAIESLRKALPQDVRLANTHKKLLLERGG